MCIIDFLFPLALLLLVIIRPGDDPNVKRACVCRAMRNAQFKALPQAMPEHAHQHEKRWFCAGPASLTLAQHWINASCGPTGACSVGMMWSGQVVGSDSLGDWTTSRSRHFKSSAQLHLSTDPCFLWSIPYGDHGRTVWWVVQTYWHNIADLTICRHWARCSWPLQYEGSNI